MQPETRSVIDALLVGAQPESNSLCAVVLAIMEGRCSPVEISALLTALAVKGESAEELAGAAQAMRAKAARITTRRTGLLDTCGTGGDRLHTFNISTAAALVAAAAGVPVAKHGNRAASSASGSADVLEALGVNVSLSPEQVGRCLDEVGIGFCFARVMHTAMKHVAPVRAELGFRTIFNLLGPLTNPAGADYQLIGASRVATAEKLAGALSQLGTRRAFVVCGADQLDEVSLWGETVVWEVAGGEVQSKAWSAATFNLPECAVGALQVEGPQQSAAVIRGVLQEGQGGARRDIIVANAAAALVAACAASSLEEGVEMALSVIASGAAGGKLEELAVWTAAHGPSS